MKKIAICLTFITAFIVGAPAARADTLPVQVAPVPRVIICYPTSTLTSITDVIRGRARAGIPARRGFAYAYGFRNR